MKLITIKMNLITIACVATAIALISFFGFLLMGLHLFYLTLIASLIGAAALIADFLRS